MKANPAPGMVETLSARELTGWLDVPRDAPPTRVGLFVDDQRVMDVAAVKTVDLATSREIRRFRFPVRDMWRYVGKHHQLTVRVDGRPLPIAGKGMYYQPANDGAASMTDLLVKLQDGWLFASDGRLRLNKNRDHAWQAGVMRLYEETQGGVNDVTGQDGFLIYGSLLGAVRDRGFIGHDFDFDCAFVSDHRTGPEAADDLVRIAYRLIDDGLVVECRVVVLHLYRPDDPDVRIDLFHSYFPESGVLGLAWGMAGDVDFTRDLWRGTEEIEFAGSTARIPVGAETLVSALYGSSWRIPNAGFTWEGNRRKRAVEARVPERIGNAVNWDAWYARSEDAGPTSFLKHVLGAPDVPMSVVDLGCGDGRDSVVFADSGRSVLGLDASEYGLRRAGARSSTLGALQFRRVDFEDPDALADTLAARATDAGTLFYGRFLLHAVHSETATVLLRAVAEHAHPGDLLALEFRSLPDDKRPKRRNVCYRRFVDADAVRDEIESLGFRVQSQDSGGGWSPWGREDPWLTRISARFDTA